MNIFYKILKRPVLSFGYMVLGKNRSFGGEEIPSIVPPVKVYCITGEQSFHQNGDWNIASPQQKMKVIGD